ELQHARRGAVSAVRSTSPHHVAQSVEQLSSWPLPLVQLLKLNSTEHAQLMQAIVISRLQASVLPLY
ncbi:hypothetical protein Ciccas_009245, partial [Cichlidogyrus casuarinus]